MKLVTNPDKTTVNVPNISELDKVRFILIDNCYITTPELLIENKLVGTTVTLKQLEKLVIKLS